MTSSRRFPRESLFGGTLKEDGGCELAEKRACLGRGSAWTKVGINKDVKETDQELSEGL